MSGPATVVPPIRRVPAPPAGDDLLAVWCPSCGKPNGSQDRNTGRVTCPCGHDSDPLA